jgi:hypothetical protein
VWWIGWERWFVGGQFLRRGFYAGFWDLFLGPAGEEQATAKTKYRDPSLSLRMTT